VIDSVNLSNEIVVIRNADSKDIDMTGWKLVSTEGNQTYHFPTGYVLKAGATVRIVSGPKAADMPPGQLAWTTANIWNNNGDTAVLYDASGKEVSRK
ncbi:lamin tail domain-containing protein, partial [Kyrpidia sp.]|uniref:lamin tail domain-containing protein n=1 Tax=Kyrpidia sp. TaxID=2073077 RepID=UPI00258D124F